MIQILNKEDCCGCTACASICASNAITMKPDDLGYLYPEINTSLCTDCGLCNKVCAFQNGYDTSLKKKTPIAYAVRHKNLKELETSRSGAMFIALSDYILSLGGVVYGAGYAEHFRVVHKRANSKDLRNEFKGSKYVQSDLDHTFLQVKTDLKNGLTVLFSGTPCQTASLNEFLGKRLKDNLVLVDIVCHGVTSPYIWEDYLCFLEKKRKQKIIKVDFRDKSLGWNMQRESFIFNDGKKEIRSTFSFLYIKNIMIRPSCAKCKYSNISRPSDITIGDFWGWEKTDAYFNKDNKGCSLVFINTEKGEKIWDTINSQLNFISANISNCMQPNLKQPTVLSKHSSDFAKSYKTKGFLNVAKHYGNLSFKYKIEQFISSVKYKINKKITQYVSN